MWQSYAQIKHYSVCISTALLRLKCGSAEFPLKAGLKHIWTPPWTEVLCYSTLNGNAVKIHNRIRFDFSVGLPHISNCLMKLPHCQVMCLSSGCLPGTYFSTSTAPIGDLESGTDVCIPCHPLCEVCIGPGTRLDDCSKCRYATRVSEQCVRSCNATSGEETRVKLLGVCAGMQL